MHKNSMFRFFLTWRAAKLAEAEKSMSHEQNELREHKKASFNPSQAEKTRK